MNTYIPPDPDLWHFKPRRRVWMWYFKRSANAVQLGVGPLWLWRWRDAPWWRWQAAWNPEPPEM
jgi:hypothetical protein